MVEYVADLDTIFAALANSTRRQILQLAAKQELTVGDIAQHFSISFAAVSKHIKVLESAQLVLKHKRGRQQYVQWSPAAFSLLKTYLADYQLPEMVDIDAQGSGTVQQPYD